MSGYSAFGTALLMGDAGRAFTGEADDDVITTSGNHGLSNADPVMLQGSTLPTGLEALTVYYVRDKTDGTFKLAATAGGAAINITVDGSGTVLALTEISQVRNISGPEMSVDMLDSTHNQSAGATREFVAGLIDMGEFGLDLLFDYDDVTHVALLDDLVARRTTGAFAVIWPDLTATTWGFTGIVSKFGPIGAPVDGMLSAPAAVKLTGAGNVT